MMDGERGGREVFELGVGCLLSKWGGRLRLGTIELTNKLASFKFIWHTQANCQRTTTPIQSLALEHF